MNCLKDYIGIIGYGSQEPLSGLYLNQLPGISLASLNKIANADQVDFAGVWNDVQARAWMRLEKDFRIALRKRYRLSAVKAFAQVLPTSTETIVPAAAKYRGLVVDLEALRHQSTFSEVPRTKGAFLMLHIDSIAVHLSEDCAQLVVKIFDRHGTVLDSFTKTDLEAGVVTIAVSKKYPVRHVFVAVDATAVPLYAAKWADEALQGCYAALRYFYTCEPSIFPAEALTATPGATTKAAQYFGISVGYGAVCDYSAAICSNKEEFMDVWLYLVGAEMMLERLYTSRMNRFTTVDRKEAEECRDFFMVEYEKRLAETVAGLDISNEDTCIECSPAVTQRTMLP